jgi:hypothetical protein
VEYKRVKPDEAPKRLRKTESKFETTPVWAELKKDLDKGWKGEDVLQVVITPADKKSLGITNPRTVPRFLRRYFEQNELQYKLKTVRRGDVDVILIHKAA